MFKEEWVAQFSWVEPMVDPTSKIHVVHYKVYSLVEGKDKILNLKLDGFQKHVGKRKAIIFHPRVLAGESYINNDWQHQRNERAYASRGPNFIVELVVNGGKA